MNNSKPEIAILLSENIKRLRKERGLTQEKLAEQVGISVRHLSDIERSDAFPSAQILELVAKVLEIPSYVLFLPMEQSRVEFVYSQRIKKLLDSEIAIALRNTVEKLTDSEQ